jgi:hypothetical protein
MQYFDDIKYSIADFMVLWSAYDGQKAGKISVMTVFFQNYFFIHTSIQADTIL